MYRRNSNGYPYISEVAQLTKHIVHTANAVGSIRKWYIEDGHRKPEVYKPLRISQHVYMIATRFQRLLPHFQGPATRRG